MGIPRDRYTDRSTVACLSLVKSTPSGAGGVFELHVLQCIHDAVRHDEVAIPLSIHRHGVPRGASLELVLVCHRAGKIKSYGCF